MFFPTGVCFGDLGEAVGKGPRGRSSVLFFAEPVCGHVCEQTRLVAQRTACA